MPITVLPELNGCDFSGGVFLKCVGVVTGEELIAINECVACCRNARFQLWDFSETTKITASPTDVHVLAMQDWEIDKDDSLEAIVAVGDNASVKDFFRLYEQLSISWVGRPRGFRSQLVHTMSDAFAWLEGQLQSAE